MNKILIIGMTILCIILLSDCTDKGNMTSNSITGTLEKVVLKGDKVELTFSNNSYGIITATNIDSDGTNWFNVLKLHAGENIKLTWIANYQEVVIAYVEYL